MFDYDMKFISFGIEYNEDKFEKVKNNIIFRDYDFPPTKPLKGGVWAAEYWDKSEYLSCWHKFMIEKLSKCTFKDKIDGISTIFQIKPASRVFAIKSYNDIKLEFPNLLQEAKKSIPVHFVKIGGNINQKCGKRLFINFEKLSEKYDVLYISQELLQTLQIELLKQDERILYGNSNQKEELLYAELVCKAQLFEDWHVGTVLVLNKECIDVLKVDTNKNLLKNRR